MTIEDQASASVMFLTDPADNLVGGALLSSSAILGTEIWIQGTSCSGHAA
jgi:hypothetical protein